MGNSNRKAIIKESIMVFLLLAALLTIGVFLVRNVAAVVGSLGNEQATGVSGFAASEKSFAEMGGKIITGLNSLLQQAPKAAPQPAAPPVQPQKPASAPTRKAEVSQVRFFEAGRQIPAPMDRTYSDRFSREARYIYIQINFKNNRYRVEDIEIPVIVQYHHETGRMIANGTRTARIKKEWASASYTTGFGAAEPGFWLSGQYTARVVVDGEAIGGYNFSVN